MAITSTFYTGAVDNVAWAKGSGRLGFSYVAHGASDCKVSAVSTGTRTVRVAVGSISGAGVTDVNGSTVDIALPNVTSGSKWFLIIADRVWQTTNATTFTYIEGTATRQLPARTVNPGVRDQQPLALVRIQAGQTIPQEIVDLRVIGSNNGIMVGFDELCLQYLDAVGTVVRIGDVEWIRDLSSAGAAVWRKSFIPWADMPAPVSTPALGTAEAGWAANDSLGSIAHTWGTDSDIILRVRRTGAALVSNSVGNFADTVIFTLKPELRPTHAYPAICEYKHANGSQWYAGHVSVEPDGKVWLRSGAPNTTLSATTVTSFQSLRMRLRHTVAS